MSHFRLGVVPYVNAMPLWVPLEKHLIPTQHTFSFEKAVPDRLSRELLAAGVDVALLSIVEPLKNRRFKIMDGVCIASRGPVETVQLFHRKPLDQCDRVLLDRDSRTSSLVSQILLAERFPRSSRHFAAGHLNVTMLTSGIATNGVLSAVDLSPLERGEAADLGAIAPTATEAGSIAPAPTGGRFSLRVSTMPIIEAPNLNDYDAFLTIGDKTWDFLESDWEHTDVGELWTDTTELPMVWAGWIATETLAQQDLVKLLNAARESGRGILDDIIKRLARGETANQVNILRYLTEVVHYKMGIEEKSAITRLWEMGHTARLLPPVGRIHIVD